MTSGDASAMAPGTESGCTSSHNFTAPMLLIQDVFKNYGALTALNGVTLEIRAGEFFGLLGPNGAGKSTLMSLVAGLRTPDRGALMLDGRPLTVANPAARAGLGLVPQAIALYEDLSAEQNLRLFGGLHGLSGSLLKARVDEALATVQLADRRHDLVKTFSGGMQRRLNLVVALLHRPKLLLCDEPTVGIDPQSRNAIFDLLEARARDGLTVIYSTHYMEEATRLCSRIAIIDHGRILAQGALPELLTQLPFEDEIRFPAAAETAALVPQLAGHGELVTLDGLHRFRPRADYRLSAFFALTESLGLSPRLFTSQRPTLEALFLHLTGRNLRE